MDKYLGFSYRGIRLGMDDDANFKGFIVNNGEDLQFVNSPEFSNEFAEMPFGKQTFYLGNTQGNRMFTFNIALKEITLQEYRDFLKWLGLDTQGVLSFDYNSEYGYDVKVDSIENGIFEVVISGSNCDVRKYNVELVVSFVTTGRAEARWVHDEPVWWKYPDANNINVIVDNDKNETWITNSGGTHLTFHNCHNVNNAIKIEFKGVMRILGVTLHGTSKTTTIDNTTTTTYFDSIYYSEYGIIIGSDGTFGSASIGTGDDFEYVEIPRLIIGPEERVAVEITGDWTWIKPTSYEII